MPTEVTGFEGRTVVNVGCGSQYTIAHTEDGQIYAWGLNLNGQLGVGDSMNRNTPSLVAQVFGGVWGGGVGWTEGGGEKGRVVGGRNGVGELPCSSAQRKMMQIDN